MGTFEITCPIDPPPHSVMRGTGYGSLCFLCIWFYAFTARAHGQDILKFLGSHFVDSIAKTPADLPRPRLPDGLKDHGLRGMFDLQEDIEERGVEDDGQHVSQASTLEAAFLNFQAAERHGKVISTRNDFRKALA